MARDVTGPVEITYLGGMPAVIVGGQLTVERGGTISVTQEIADDLIAGGDFAPAKAKAAAKKKAQTTTTSQVDEETQS